MEQYVKYSEYFDEPDEMSLGDKSQRSQKTTRDSQDNDKRLPSLDVLKDLGTRLQTALDASTNARKGMKVS